MQVLTLTLALALGLALTLTLAHTLTLTLTLTLTPTPPQPLPAGPAADRLRSLGGALPALRRPRGQCVCAGGGHWRGVR